MYQVSLKRLNIFALNKFIWLFAYVPHVIKATQTGSTTQFILTKFLCSKYRKSSSQKLAKLNSFAIPGKISPRKIVKKCSNEAYTSNCSIFVMSEGYVQFPSYLYDSLFPLMTTFIALTANILQGTFFKPKNFLVSTWENYFLFPLKMFQPFFH